MLNRRYRSRRLLVAGMVLVVGAGLASRSFPQALPLGLGGYPGDALWALLVFLALAFARPGSRTSRLAMAALSVSYLVEAAQLYQDPWVNSIRSTSAGHLVLGQGFDWRDLLAYTVGVGVASGIDVLLARLGKQARSAA